MCRLASTIVAKRPGLVIRLAGRAGERGRAGFKPSRNQFILASPAVSLVARFPVSRAQGRGEVINTAPFRIELRLLRKQALTSKASLLPSMNAFASRPPRGRTQPRAPRARVLLPAAVVTMSAYQFPELVDISHAGAKLRGSPLPPQGSTALLRVGALEVLCRVMWAGDDECGVRFDEAVSPRMLKQVELDGAVALELVAPDRTQSRRTD